MGKKKKESEMPAGGDCKVATVEVEASQGGDTATLPVTRPLNPQGGDQPGAQDNAEKNNAANKEMELKNVRSTPAKKTSLFIIMSFIYAKLLVVVCIAYVLSEVVTHRLPLYYYEGFFTYLYGVSILFLLYVFCFLLQESACCSKGAETPPPPQPKKEKKEKEKKDKKDKKDKKEKDKDKDKKDKKEFQDASDVEAGVATRALRKRKTTQNDSQTGSFFLRIGAIAFGLGTMVYSGLEFGTFFEVPPTSPCYQILQGVNPVLQMIFTFMQMYFIFMNSRLNIHRFKVIARFGLMHVVATNICVWIRTLVLESIKEIAQYHQAQARGEIGLLASIKDHTLRNAGVFLGERARDPMNLRLGSTPYPNKWARDAATTASTINRMVRTTVRPMARAVTMGASTGNPTDWPASSTWVTSMATDAATSTSTMAPTTSATAATTLSTFLTTLMPAKRDMVTTSAATIMGSSTGFQTEEILSDIDLQSDSKNNIPRFMDAAVNATTNFTGVAAVSQLNPSWNPAFNMYAEALTASASSLLKNNTCGRVNIMGTIVKDAAPYLYPFIIEYSLIGAAVIFIMWKHIGRYPRWPHQAEADLERRLEAMLSRRAVAMANADESAENDESAKVDIPEEVKVEEKVEEKEKENDKDKAKDKKEKSKEKSKDKAKSKAKSKDKVAKGQGRMDCVGASKGLFFGLLLLVAALICLILFFVLINHPDFGLLAIYLADVSHCAIMALSIFAIIIGFCRVKNLKFKAEDQSDLNDILLRVSGFGLFTYSTFSVISGSLAAFTLTLHEPNLLVMVTGLLAVFQVILQLLFIADVSRRRVHLPEHDRTKPGRQIVTFLLICNVAMWVIYTFEAQKVARNPVQIDFYGYLPWSIVQRVCIPLCIFHRFHSAVTLAEIWKTSYKPRLE